MQADQIAGAVIGSAMALSFGACLAWVAVKAFRWVRIELMLRRAHRADVARRISEGRPTRPAPLRLSFAARCRSGLYRLAARL